MLKENLLPASGKAIHRIGLLGDGYIVKLPIKETVLCAAFFPFVSSSFMIVFVKKGLLMYCQYFSVVLIARYNHLVIGVCLFVIAV